MARWSSGLRLRPLTPATRVRISYGSPKTKTEETPRVIYAVKSSITVGVYDDEGPPVPIPNTVVKLIRAENTWREAARKDRSTPTPYRSGRPIGRSFSFFIKFRQPERTFVRPGFFLSERPIYSKREQNVQNLWFVVCFPQYVENGINCVQLRGKLCENKVKKTVDKLPMCIYNID